MEIVPKKERGCPSVDHTQVANTERDWMYSRVNDMQAAGLDWKRKRRNQDYDSMDSMTENT
jgi:hypothetical protein